ncbi:MAG: BTAD domain-containing putative transcriptional regulator, partial [Schlesneria sp.]
VETIRSRFGNSTRLQAKIIELYRAEGKLDQALELVTEIFPRVQQMPAAYLTRGSILLDLGRSDEAIVDLEKSNQLEPYNERSQFKLSEAYRSSGKKDLSEKHRQLGERIRRNRIRINELMKNLSHASQREYEELSSLHLGLGAPETARYWKQRAQIPDK